MTVRQLKQLLEGVDETLPVLMYRDDPMADIQGGFLFSEVCEHETCEADLGEPNPEHGEFGGSTRAFLIMPHGVASTEEPKGDDFMESIEKLN